MDEEEYERLMARCDPDGKIRNHVQLGVKRIERRYAFFHFLLALLGIVLIGGVFFVWFRFGFSSHLIVIPIGLLLLLGAMLVAAIKRMITGKPDEHTRRIVSENTKRSNH